MWRRGQRICRVRPATLRRARGASEESNLDVLELVEIIRDGSWLNPARSFKRSNLLVLGAKFCEGASAGALAVTSLEKVGMVARTADGLTPLDDSFMLEQSGTLVPVVSGMLWPAAQFSAFILLGFAIATLLLEEMHSESLRAIVDVDAMRRRRFNTVACFAACAALMILPPIPGMTEI